MTHMYSQVHEDKFIEKWNFPYLYGHNIKCQYSSKPVYRITPKAPPTDIHANIPHPGLKFHFFTSTTSCFEISNHPDMTSPTKYGL